MMGESSKSMNRFENSTFELLARQNNNKVNIKKTEEQFRLKRQKKGRLIDRR